MFAVYNKGSVQFRSTADNLYSVDKIDNLAGSRLKPDDELYQYLDDYIKSKKEKDTSYTDKALSSYKKVAKMKTTDVVYHVADIMTKECITVNEDASIYEAYELLKENKISQIPIVTLSNQIVGLINKKIILNTLMEDLDNIKEILQGKLKELQLPEYVATEAISDIRRVAKVMISHKIDAMPVVSENGLLLGIVSKTDIIKALSHIPDLQLWA